MKSEKGFTFIEVVIGLAIMGVIAVGFIGGLGTAAKGLMIADERETANNLAEAQMENVKNQQYIDYSEDPHGVYDTIGTPPNYSVVLTAVPFDPVTRQPHNDLGGGIFDFDEGIQEITVTVNHQDKLAVITLEDYKVN